MSSAGKSAFSKVVGALDRALQPIEVAAAIIAGVFMLAAMVLTSSDAILRYTVNAPITFSFYLTEKYLLVGLMTMPMAWGFRTGGYIRLISILFLLSPLAKSLLLRAGLLISAGYIGVLAWLSAGHFWEVFKRGDVQMGVIDWPVAWSWVWIPIGLTLLTLRLVIISVGPEEVSDDAEGQGVEEAI